ncbi:MAG: UDP-N-acetylglucosamine 1-carboxyvinyltransferase [Oscillospiraceae bacterium]|nr:UDP-N-acetylglucosamine 1-carboxyvinyltransferase [Oscillospiraceae bacterium]
MGAYWIEGGVPLRGELAIHGAKNSVLPILAATILTGGCCVLHNCPRISDVETALQILEYLGCKTKREGSTLCIDTYEAVPRPIPVSMTGRMRAAILFMGSLLARFGQAYLAYPGGCALGERPVDLHLLGLRHMGAHCDCTEDCLCCKSSCLEGGTIALPFPSVGATENLLLAATACKGDTVLCNCACEPEIGDLVDFLRCCGAQICGKGSVLQIRGGCSLHGGEFSIMPDRMEAASYLAAGAATKGELTLTHVCPHHLEAVTAVLRKGGCELREGKDYISLRCEQLRAVSPIRTAPYNGFPTDAQAPIMAALASAKGISVIEERIFSNRFLHVPALRKMGARIRASRHYAIIDGVSRLCGAEVEATDLRGGAALVIAALSAQGRSRIGTTEHMERGYEDFAPNLMGLGAKLRME